MSNYQIVDEYNKNLMYIMDALKKSGETNNIELERLGKTLFSDLFLGVFSAEKFPKYIRNNELFIINNKSSRAKEGQHWVAFIKSSKNKDHTSRLYGYDSFNRDIHKLSPHFRHRRFINANSNRDESFFELNCGERCMAFLISFYKHGDKVIRLI